MWNNHGRKEALTKLWLRLLHRILLLRLLRLSCNSGAQLFMPAATF
jgi:hypothetical protein